MSDKNPTQVPKEILSQIPKEERKGIKTTCEKVIKTQLKEKPEYVDMDDDDFEYDSHYKQKTDECFYKGCIKFVENLNQKNNSDELYNVTVSVESISQYIKHLQNAYQKYPHHNFGTGVNFIHPLIENPSEILRLESSVNIHPIYYWEEIQTSHTYDIQEIKYGVGGGGTGILKKDFLYKLGKIIEKMETFNLQAKQFKEEKGTSKDQKYLDIFKSIQNQIISLFLPLTSHATSYQIADTNKRSKDDAIKDLSKYVKDFNTRSNFYFELQKFINIQSDYKLNLKTEDTSQIMSEYFKNLRELKERFGDRGMESAPLMSYTLDTSILNHLDLPDYSASQFLYIKDFDTSKAQNSKSQFRPFTIGDKKELINLIKGTKNYNVNLFYNIFDVTHNLFIPNFNENKISTLIPLIKVTIKPTTTSSKLQQQLDKFWHEEFEYDVPLSYIKEESLFRYKYEKDGSSKSLTDNVLNYIIRESAPSLVRNFIKDKIFERYPTLPKEIVEELNNINSPKSSIDYEIHWSWQVGETGAGGSVNAPFLSGLLLTCYHHNYQKLTNEEKKGVGKLSLNSEKGLNLYKSLGVPILGPLKDGSNLKGVTLSHSNTLKTFTQVDLETDDNVNEILKGHILSNETHKHNEIVTKIIKDLNNGDNPLRFEKDPLIINLVKEIVEYPLLYFYRIPPQKQSQFVYVYLVFGGGSGTGLTSFIISLLSQFKNKPLINLSYEDLDRSTKSLKKGNEVGVKIEKTCSTNLCRPGLDDNTTNITNFLLLQSHILANVDTSLGISKLKTTQKYSELEDYNRQYSNQVPNSQFRFTTSQAEHVESDLELIIPSNAISNILKRSEYMISDIDAKDVNKKIHDSGLGSGIRVLHFTVDLDEIFADKLKKLEEREKGRGKNQKDDVNEDILEFDYEVVKRHVNSQIQRQVEKSSYALNPKTYRSTLFNVSSSHNFPLHTIQTPLIDDLPKMLIPFGIEASADGKDVYNNQKKRVVYNNDISTFGKLNIELTLISDSKEMGKLNDEKQNGFLHSQLANKFKSDKRWDPSLVHRHTTITKLEIEGVRDQQARTQLSDFYKTYNNAYFSEFIKLDWKSSDYINQKTKVIEAYEKAKQSPKTSVESNENHIDDQNLSNLITGPINANSNIINQLNSLNNFVGSNHQSEVKEEEITTPEELEQSINNVETKEQGFFKKFKIFNKK